MTPERLRTVLGRRLGRDALARDVLAEAEATGVDVLVVGGYVRDAALGRPASTDIDLAAGVGARRLVRALETRWSCRAFRFVKRGITTWRLAPGNRRVDIVDAGRRGFDEDLRRRELTVNAIAWDVRGRRVVDPLRGLSDLRAGRLRPPRAGAFVEDPVRALRAARFVAQYPELRLTAAARREAATAAGALRRAPRERVGEELDKLLTSRDPVRGLDTLDELGLVDAVLPELVPLAACVAGAERPDVWRHTLDALSLAAWPARIPGAAAAREPGGARCLRWAVLLHDVAKPDTLDRRDDGRPTFHGHEILGARRAEAMLRRLCIPGSVRGRVVQLIRLHLRPSLLAEAGAPERGLRRLAREAGDDTPLLAVHAACDARASGTPDDPARWRRLTRLLRRLLDRHEELHRSPPPALVDGRDIMRHLGVEPGPRVGELLERVRQAQDDGEIGSREEALAFAADVASRAEKP